MNKLILSALLCTALSAHAEIYKRTDANGNVTFTDQPDPNAETVDIPATNTLPAVSPQKPRKKAVTASGYDNVSILQPRNDEAIVARDGNVNVEVATTPALKRGHTIEILVDGQIASAGIAGTHPLTGLNRGSHAIEALITGSDGEVLASSGSITVHIIWPGAGRSSAR